MSIEEIVMGLKEQGLDEPGIQKALEDMLEAGEISQEDYDAALAMLAGGEQAPVEEPQETEEMKEDRVFGKL